MTPAGTTDNMNSVFVQNYLRAASSITYNWWWWQTIEKLKQKKSEKSLPVSEFKALSLSVSSLPRNQREHGKKTEWEKDRKGGVAEGKRYSFWVGFVLPLVVRRYLVFTMQLFPCQPLRSPVITISKQTQCVVLLFLFAQPRASFKRVGWLSTTPGLLNFLPVTLGHFAIGCSTCNSLQPST